MKRPVPIYFIAVWCFLALGYQSGALITALGSRFPEGQVSKDVWSSLRACAMIFVIWNAVGLAQLRPFNRWFSVIFFLLWTLAMGLNCVVLFPRFHNPIRVIAVLSLYGALNVISAYYLLRPSFRQFANDFVAERQREKKSRDMQRISEKKILHDAKR